VLQFPARKFSLRSITNTLMQPRLAMTAAMAFFSIALTMNLTGVKLSELRASDLTPTNLKRSFYHADASVVRYYTNLRVVYELESRVRDLQRSNESDNASPAVSPSNGSAAPNGDSNKDKPEDKDQPRKPSPKSGSGTSQRRGPLDQQFKLAGASRQGMSGRAASLATVAYPQVAVRKDKSKETLQEGDLV
jgi:hypothetical protein